MRYFTGHGVQQICAVVMDAISRDTSNAAASHAATAVVIRRYRPSDRETVRRICCDNSCLGMPIDPACPDRELFAAVFVDPYIDHYPQWAFVAEADRVVVGYLISTIDPGFFRHQVAAGTRVLGMLGRAALRASPPAERAFMRWLLFRSWRERPRRPRIPAHMHFGVEPAWRGRYVARSLWRTFEAQLIASGEPGYYGEVLTGEPEKVIRVYGRYRLRPFGRARSTMLAHAIQRPAWTICFVRTFDTDRA